MQAQDELKAFRVEARHEVEATYKVMAKDEDDAIRRLCNIELFAEYTGNTFGPCDDAMDRNGISLVHTNWCGDPLPTGRTQTQQDWEVVKDD